MARPEKFLILGASSFYGKSFADLAEKKGAEVRRAGPYWRLGDMPPFLDDVDIVVNFASQSLVEESWVDTAKWTDANFTQTTKLVKQAAAFKNIKKFIHVSTPESYGSHEPWVTEDYRDWQPSTPYAVSRAAADLMMMAYYRAFQFPVIITRTANIYGLGQTSNRIIPLAFSTLRNGKSLELDGGGTTRRSFIHIKDACEGTWRIALYGSAGQTYHISTQSLVKIKDLCAQIAVLLGLNPNDVLGSRQDRVGKDECYALASDKIRALGWRDTITLTTGLEEWASK